jgi:hypothetical protein
MKKLITIAILTLSLGISAAAFAKGSAGYVKLYEDKDFGGRTVTIYFNKSVPDMHAHGFNDKASSVKYKIPAGYMATLHADTGYGGSKYDMEGSGSVANLASFEDKCSSVEWHKQ